jgi:DNA-binding IclR family transcriptional regulator
MATLGAPDVVADADPTSLVTRAFVLLGAFRTHPVLGVSELSRRTGIPRTTVHRLANQLVDVGALGRVGVRFRLGPTLFELGNLHYPPKMRETLQPFLEDLQHLSGGDVGLLEPVGRDVIFIQTARARKSPSTLVKLGSRVPASACVGGVVLTAFNTTRPTRRHAEIRARGYTVDHGGDEPGRTGVAAAVANRRGRVLGALMVSVPMTRSDDDLARVVNATTMFARTLTLAGQSADVDFLAHAHPKT